MVRSVKIMALLLALGTLLGCAERGGEVKAMSDILVGALDTVSTVTLYGTEDRSIIGDIFDAVSDIDARMSAHSADSELAQINSGGNDVTVSQDTYDLIEKALEISEASDGAFDITIREVMELWGIGTDAARIPSDIELADALRRVDYQNVSLGEKYTVSLTKPGMSIDLGGIAKGYACDIAVSILRERGIEHALIDLGGNIYAYGSKPDGLPWSVGVKTPIAGENGYFCVVRVSSRAVVTSGVYERYFAQDGKIYHHIMNPSTGKPADSGLLSVTIISQSSTKADALSTACFVLGLERGMDLLSEMENTQGIFVTDSYEVYTTPELTDIIELTDDRFTLVKEQ